VTEERDGQAYRCATGDIACPTVPLAQKQGSRQGELTLGPILMALIGQRPKAQRVKT
jgi:hypothetical protein